jgi:hypothetical protein
MSVRGGLVIGVVGLISALAVVRVDAQAPALAVPPPPPADAIPLRMLAAGGFLGQLDGFCEHPGGTYDISVVATHCLPGGPGGRVASDEAARKQVPGQKWPAALGGVLGVKSWIDQYRQPASSLLFIIGNNQPADYSFGVQESVTPRQVQAVAYDTARKRSSNFWKEIGDLKPTVVALGPEDFIRSLRNPAGPAAPGRAEAFVTWVRDNPLPLLASNAIVKLTRENLNTVKSGDYELEIDEDQSVDWVSSLKLAHPSNAIMTITLEESANSLKDATTAGTAIGITSTLDPNDSSHTTLTVSTGSLLPARHYRLRVAAEGQTHTFLFRTHRALLPATLERDPRVGPTASRVSAAELLTGFSVAVNPLTVRTGSVPVNERDDMLILSLVDPDTNLGLGTSAWTYEVREAGEEPIEASVAFSSPATVVGTLFRRLAVAGARTPYVVLLSSLGDEITLDLLETYPEIRTVVLPPESALLGRASRQTDTNPAHVVERAFGARRQVNANDPTTYSGDLGFGSVVDVLRPTAAQVWTRPEWIGETGATIDVSLARNPYGEWGTYRPAVEVRTIPGTPLDYERRGDEVVYWPVGRKDDLLLGPYKAYLPNPSQVTPKNLENFLSIWKNAGTFAVAAGDALRKALAADVAVVPDDLYDRDAIAWLAYALDGSNGEWLSRFILERAIFRSHRFVRADVPGSELFDKVGKALSDPLDVGTKACAVGMNGPSCRATFDKQHPERVRVRDRAIVTSVFYNVTAPDAIAQKLELEHDDEIADSRDALGVVDHYLMQHLWEETVNLQPPSLGELVAGRARRERRSYLNVRTLELGLDQMFVGEPEGREGVLANLPVDFKAAKPERTVSGKLDLDLATEGPRFAGRVLGMVDMSKRTVFKKDPTPDEITFPRDSFMVGARVEVRKLQGDDAIERRYYGGVFKEGPGRPTELNLTATRDGDTQRDGFKTQERAGFQTPLSFAPSQFLYGAGGIELLPAAKDIIPAEALSATITKATADVAGGTQSNVLVGLKLGGVEQSLDRFLGEGAQKLLNEYFANNSAAFTDAVKWEADLRSKRQMRIRLNLEGEIGWKPSTKTYKATVAFQYNYFRVQDAPDLALANSIKFTSDFKIPLWWRLEVVPSYEVQRASIRASSNDTFWAQRFKVRANIPLFIRFGRGRFVQ